MSRIYDALKQAEGVQATSLAQLIDDSHVHSSVSSAEPLEGGFDTTGVAGPDDLVLPGEYENAQHDLGVSFRSVKLASPAGTPLFPFDDSKAAEQYRILRTNLLQHELSPRIIGVASATPGDGKTLTAINLAGILALKGESSVLLVDSDLRQRSINGVLGIEGSPGLTNVVSGSCALEGAVIHIEQYPGLYVLPAGDALGNPAELLDSPVFRELVEGLAERFSYVVFDTTPMTEVTDFRLIQRVCQGILVVVRPDHTSRAALLKASQVQDREKALGTVINAVDDWFLWKSGGHYRYYPRDAAKKPAGAKRWFTKSSVRP